MNMDCWICWDTAKTIGSLCLLRTPKYLEERLLTLFLSHLKKMLVISFVFLTTNLPLLHLAAFVAIQKQAVI